MSIRLEKISLASTECSSGGTTGVDTSNGDVYQEQSDGCLYQMPIQDIYLKDVYATGIYPEGVRICP